MDSELDDQLFTACADGDIAQVKQALQEGADIHADDDRALLNAAFCMHTEIVKFLLNHEPPADVHVNDDEALRKADKGGYGYEKTGIELMRYGADQFDSPRMREWVGKMSRRAQQAFSDGVSEDTCFTDGEISDTVLDACATQQFGTLIGTPLLVAKNFELFKRVWDALPECWQAANLSLHSQFARENRAAAVGK